MNFSIYLDDETGKQLNQAGGSWLAPLSGVPLPRVP